MTRIAVVVLTGIVLLYSLTLFGVLVVRGDDRAVITWVVVPAAVFAITLAAAWRRRGVDRN